MREAWGNNALIPLYDAEDAPCGIVYNGTPYYFLKNLQGDIIAIVNENRETVARYRYDAWGVCTIISDTSNCNIATINPFRYRGYYYDEEIAMYYLQSRYYDPEIGRFINADILENATIPQTNNLFSYCNNNPINDNDASGNLVAKTVAKFVVYAVFGLLAQLASDIIEFLFNKIVKGKNISLSTSPMGDYLGSALSWGMCALDLFNNKLLAFLAPFLPVAVKHLTNIIRGSFSWYSFLIDIAAAFVAGFISIALNKAMSDKLSKIKRGSGNSYANYKRYLNKQLSIKVNINKSFFKASLNIIISTTILQLLANLLFKK